MRDVACGTALRSVQAVFSGEFVMADFVAESLDFDAASFGLLCIAFRVKVGSLHMNQAKFEESLSCVDLDVTSVLWGDGLTVAGRASLTLRCPQVHLHDTNFGAGLSLDESEIELLLMSPTCKTLSLRGVRSRSIHASDTVITDQSGLIGPVMSDYVSFDRSSFSGRTELEVLANSLSLEQIAILDETTFKIRYADVSLDGADLGAAVTVVTGQDFSWVHYEGIQGEFRRFDESVFRQRHGSETARIVSLRGVDASHLLLVSVDLKRCMFANALNLDSIQIEAAAPFSNTPRGLRGIWWWTPRQSLFEEHLWRAKQPRSSGWLTEAGLPEMLRSPYSYRPGDYGIGPERLTRIYRAVRKSYEDSKDEPGAADFYYGEMEMRRRSTGTPAVERGILFAYWLTSGYSLRGLRSLASLCVTLLALSILFAQYGFAQAMPLWRALIYSASFSLSLPYDDAPNITDFGMVLQVILRLTGPLFLGLTLLSVRNRVKR
ncbi:hypothetical protein [Sphaerisporangium dianthi]|uniref:Pentapeptide repeat-containing protein n=1 Tax=Sphaerisporangium dianthi TaxID=1436120 RepID=A0ABV9CCP4_9ACTN